MKLLVFLRTGACILICVTAAVGLAPAADSSVTCFLPVFQSDSNGFLGLSLVNTAGLINEASVTWTDAEGARLKTLYRLRWQ